VRRLLEKDLGLEKFALDVHKRFVKQCLFEVCVYIYIYIFLIFRLSLVIGNFAYVHPNICHLFDFFFTFIKM
jgi:hypothetical protein